MSVEFKLRDWPAGTVADQVELCDEECRAYEEGVIRGLVADPALIGPNVILVKVEVSVVLLVTRPLGRLDDLKISGAGREVSGG
jgi:hypothetical protein